MAKRRINEQQKRRIETIQQKRRKKASSNSQKKQQQLEKQGLGPEQTGQIITNSGHSVIVEDD